MSSTAEQNYDDDYVYNEGERSENERTNTIEQGQDAVIMIENKETGGEWELTWPIWHMLPRADRKALALQHGMKTIGEFEEYMSLHKAEALSVGMTVGPQPSASEFSTNFYARGSKIDSRHEEEKKSDSETSLKDAFEKKLKLKDEVEDGRKLPAVDNDYESDSDGNDEDMKLDTLISRLKQSSSSDPQSQKSSPTSLVVEGGIILSLPDDIIHKVFSYLDVDYYSVCALVHSTWASFTRTEDVYRQICERCYLRQSKRKQLQPHRFNNSYRVMLNARPRVRTGSGIYVLKYRHVKKIQRDMWTEIPAGTVLETVYYRYLHFLEDGRVLYALSIDPPQDIIRRIKLMKKNYSSCNGVQQKSSYKDKNIVWGRYQVSKYDVTVWANQSWCSIILNLKIIPTHKRTDSHYYNYMNRPIGKFCSMELVRHRTTDRPTPQNFDFDQFVREFELNESNDYYLDKPGVVDYKVPHEWFRFIRDWRL